MGNFFCTIKWTHMFLMGDQGGEEKKGEKWKILPIEIMFENFPNP